MLNANKQNTLITESINGTTDTYGMINSGLDITVTQILGATVSNQAGYAVLPLRKNGYWYFVIMAVSAASGHPVIAVAQGTQFSVWYIKTK